MAKETSDMGTSYPDRYEHLQELTGRVGAAAPDVMGGFSTLHEAGTRGGALSTKSTELIALAISIAVHCDSCIAYHVHDALRAGATRSEIVDAIGVAVMMGGGPSAVYGCQALEAVDQFEAATA